ncbi:uncharacterized protein [Nicotiana tomentosiformis]|uniref:uncharacterized protein n=1 Tax=Nicotiana tomentosiformis TaxID=4098 RepID=UPI00388C7F36
MAMITKDFKKYLRRGKGPSSYSKSKVPEKQTNDGCYKYRKTDHHIKNCPQWESEWKKERAERRNEKKEQVQPKKSKGSIEAMVAAWGESSYKSSDDDDGDEQAFMAIGESYEEIEVQVKESSQIWYMDSGCSKHMTENKNQFLSLEDLKGGNVSFGNGKIGEIIGVIKVGKNDSHSIENVYLIDGLKCMTRPLVEKTPYELLKGRKPNTSYLRAFGCKCFVYNNGKDSLGPSTQGNLTGETEQRRTDPQTLREPVHEPVPQQQITKGTSKGNQLDADWVNEMQYELNQFERSQVWHLAPRAWYERLSKYLLDHGYKRGKIDNTLFLKEKGKDLLVVQIYVDDIIFGKTTDKLSKEFAKLMGSEFKMSMIGELNFFLGLQIKQNLNGTLIHQQKYVKELLKRF